MALRVVIPSRYASTRLPGKPLIDLLGVPMIVRVFQRVHEALPECECIVALDDVQISSVLDNHNIPWMMTRKDHESGTDRIAEVACLAGWADSDIVINVQGDEPLIPSAMLSAFKSLIQSRPDFEMATVVAPVETLETLTDSNAVKVITNRNGNAIYFSRHAIPFNRDIQVEMLNSKNYKRHVGVYAYRVELLKQIANTSPVFIELSEKLEQLRALWLGIDISVLEWTEQPPHGVDTLEDVHKVISVLKEAEHG